MCISSISVGLFCAVLWAIADHNVRGNKRTCCRVSAVGICVAGILSGCMNAETDLLNKYLQEGCNSLMVIFSVWYVHILSEHEGKLLFFCLLAGLTFLLFACIALFLQCEYGKMYVALGIGFLAESLLTAINKRCE